MFSKLYDKCLKLASHKSANLYLSIVSFIESSFFPIPPDVMIVPMAIAKKSSYFKIFLNATIFSVLHLGLFYLTSELIYLGALTSFVTLATSGRWS